MPLATEQVNEQKQHDADHHSLVEPTRRKEKTFGTKAYDWVIYPFINVGVIALSVYSTYMGKFAERNEEEQRFGHKHLNQFNWWIKKRFDNTEDLLFTHFTKDDSALTRDENDAARRQHANDYTLVAWSFADGSLFTPLVAWLESKRHSISHFIDKTCHTLPKDGVDIEEEPKRGLGTVMLSRIVTFAIVYPTAKFFSKRDASVEGSQSINDKVFSGFGNFAGEKWQQFRGVDADAPSVKLVRNLGYTLAFETVYSTLCTVGLDVFGGLFASIIGNHAEQKPVALAVPDAPTSEPAAPRTGPPRHTSRAAIPGPQTNHTERAANRNIEFSPGF